MKILNLVAENVKKLRVVDITPTSDFIQVTGKNGSGKTSVLDSIWWALSGTKGIQSQPIRKGANKARIRLDMGEIVVERKFTEAGSTLVVENAQGARFPSPQAMLDALVGHLSFDPLTFANMDPRKQYSELKRVANVELDFELLEAESKADYDKRTGLNREAKDLRAKAGDIAGKAVPEKVDVNKLVASMQSSAEHNATVEKQLAIAAQSRSRLAAIGGEIAQLEQKLKDALVEQSERQNWLRLFGDGPPRVDLSEIRLDIDNAQKHNAACDAYDRQLRCLMAAEEMEAKAEALTEAIAARDEQRRVAIQAAKMPVPGLSLESGRVILNGIPFDQASAAEQLRTSVAIAMAGSPKLKVIRIKDGSLLDDEGLALIAELAGENGFQVWIERVETSGKVGIMMEDGQVSEQPARKTETAAQLSN